MAASVTIFHNLVWSKYKGNVFGSLFKSSLNFLDINFIQIAETENDRIGLSCVDLSFHQYPFKLLFKGSYSDVAKLTIVRTLFSEVYRAKSDLIVLPGYDKLEYWAMLLACIIRGKRKAVFCDSTAYDRSYSLFKYIAKTIFFRLCDGFFCYGIRSREYLISHGVKSDLIYYRCQSAALPHGYSPHDALVKRVSHDRLAHTPRYLYVGRLSAEKGLDTLLTAFKSVTETYTQAELVLVGSGPLHAELLFMVEKLDLSANVTFTGGLPIESIVDEYVKATCLVLPSRSEPWGLVVNEALSYGCPVVVSNVCGCVPELVKDGVTGYSYLNDDAEQLAVRMLQLTGEFTDTAEVANQCLRLISEYSPEHAAHQILIGCQDILNAPRAS